MIIIILKDEILETSGGLPHPSKERNLDIRKRIGDLVSFNHSKIGTERKNRQPVLWWFNDRGECVFVCVDRREKSGGA